MNGQRILAGQRGAIALNEFWVGFGRGHDGMDLQLFLLIVVVVTALGFDFTNGFHDTANAMATSIASGALAPKVAVALSASRRPSPPA